MRWEAEKYNFDQTGVMYGNSISGRTEHDDKQLPIPTIRGSLDSRRQK